MVVSNAIQDIDQAERGIGLANPITAPSTNQADHATAMVLGLVQRRLSPRRLDPTAALIASIADTNTVQTWGIGRLINTIQPTRVKMAAK